MDFVIDSDEEKFSKTNSKMEQEHDNKESSIDFSFLIDDDDEENVLDNVKSDASDESDNEEDSLEDSVCGKDENLESTKSDTNSHPLAHLFDDVEVPATKSVLKKSNVKKTTGNRKSATNTKQKSLSEKLFEGLTRKSKKSLEIIKQSKKDEEIDKLLAKSDLCNMDPEEMFRLQARPKLSKRQLKRQKKEELEKTKGDKWFGLPATEMTDEVKRDLELLKMRSVLDPKRFYKKNDLQVLPKYFQIGKVIDSPKDFYSHRLTKKERKKTLVDELMADAEFSRYSKNKYAEILKEKQKTHYKAWRQAKRLKKNK